MRSQGRGHVETLAHTPDRHQHGHSIRCEAMNFTDSADDLATSIPIETAAQSFSILDPLNSSDYQEWVALWAHTAHREPQAHPNYGMTMTPSSDRFLCAIAVRPHGSVILPFAIRDIPIPSANPARDAITPYGYGGAYVDGHVDTEWFWIEWDRWARLNGIAGVTIRSHLFTDEVAATTGSSVSPLKNVVVDLTQDEGDIWAGYEGRVRTDIRRGRALGVTVTVDEACDDLEEFHTMYTETMNAKGADPFYSFTLSALESMVSAMPASVTLFHAFLHGRRVSSEMQLLGTKNAYYFLSGSLEDARRARANPVMKHEVIRWLKAKSVSRYVLGGGMKAGDSLFRYKRAYAPRGAIDFTVLFHETSPGIASSLVDRRHLLEPEWIPLADFVPRYRAPTQTGEGP